MTEDRWLNETEDRAWRGFLRMQRLLGSYSSKQLQRDHGLSAPDYEILVNLSEAPSGSMRAFEIAEATQWEKSRLSHHLTRMGQRGLIERRRCADNTRYADVVLTDRGREAITEAAPAHVAAVRKVFFDPIPLGALDAFIAVCEAVSNKLESDPDGTSGE